jgi:hypothetical protein
MWRRFWITTAFTVVSITAVSAESLYLTTSERIEKYGIGDSYTFIAPYVTRVGTAFSVSIAKAAATAGSANSDSKAVAPSITHAVYHDDVRQIVYSVSCDLTTVLHPGDKDVFTVDPAKPTEFGGTNPVLDVKSNTVTVKAEKKPSDPFKSGTVTGTSCPPLAEAGGFSVTFSVTAVPVSRAYLYLSRNSLFADTVNVSVDSNDMLSSSDSSSAQQITAILTELAQTAGLFPGAAIHTLAIDAKIAPVPTPRQRCFSAIASQLKSGPFYAIPTDEDIKGMKRGRPWTIHFDPGVDPDVTLAFDVKPIHSSVGLARLTETRTVEFNGKRKDIYWHNGLVAFFPTPARATSFCNVMQADSKGNKVAVPVYLNAPSMVNLYGESQFIDPQRDFLTNPQDTLTFNAGFFTGHKFTGQSSAKTIIDTVTAPIRALVPSVSVQQNTSVVTSPGKPDQTTTSTQTTTGPPKAP